VPIPRGADESGGRRRPPYHEIVLNSDKSNLTLRGEDRKQTVIAYPNNDVLRNALIDSR